MSKMYRVLRLHTGISAYQYKISRRYTERFMRIEKKRKNIFKSKWYKYVPKYEFARRGRKIIAVTDTEYQTVPEQRVWMML